MRSLLNALRQLAASLRMLLIFTVILGIAYPLLITVIAQIPGLKSRADGSTLSQSGKQSGTQSGTRSGKVVGSKLLGQSFVDSSSGNALPQYFQSRPSQAGSGYDPTASSASNLGPESIVDTLPDPSDESDTGKHGLLTQVCTRSLAVGQLEGVSGARPFCAPDGTGSVLAVFYSSPGYLGHVTDAVAINEACPARPFLSSYDGVKVECGKFGADYSGGKIVPIRGDAPSNPVVPADAVTASGSGLDPEISPAYADLQEARVAKTRGVTVARVAALVMKFEQGRDLGFLGEPRVNVLELNLALDSTYPAR